MKNDDLENIGHAMMLAWQRVKKAETRMWGEWMTIGEGLMEGRRWAMQTAGTNRPEGKGYVIAFAEWLKRFRIDDMDKSDRAKLLQLMEERPAVEEWRSTLSDKDRRSINNPLIVWRKWTAATRVKKPKPRTASVPASEYGRAQGHGRAAASPYRRAWRRAGSGTGHARSTRARLHARRSARTRTAIADGVVKGRSHQ